MRSAIPCNGTSAYNGIHHQHQRQRDAFTQSAQGLDDRHENHHSEADAAPLIRQGGASGARFADRRPNISIDGRSTLSSLRQVVEFETLADKARCLRQHQMFMGKIECRHHDNNINLTLKQCLAPA